MFPIRDHNPSRRTPFVTYGLIAANILIFISYYHLFSQPRALQSFYYDWALIPAAFSDGQLMHGIVTHMFLHGGLMHIAGNMLFLWIFGDNLEDILGHVGFLVFYLMSGFAAAFAQIFADPNSIVPMVGASGAIAGVMGGYLVLFPRARVDVLFIFIIFFRIIPLPAYVMLGVWFGLQLFSGATTVGQDGGVAYWAHAGGFLAGVLMVLPAWIRRGAAGFWSRTHGHPDHPETRYSQSSIPIVKRRR